jgi:hypothetical protein
MKTGITILSLFLATLMQAAPCGIHGDSKPGSREHTLNPFKNRSQAPPTFDPSITLEALAESARSSTADCAVRQLGDAS